MLIKANALHLPLADGCVQTCVTSPPYWGLRDYGVAGQLGLESTPAEYVEKMVAVFREVRRVLAADGTLWLNLGDTYSSQGGSKAAGQYHHNTGQGQNRQDAGQPARSGVEGYKPKDLIGIHVAIPTEVLRDVLTISRDTRTDQGDCPTLGKLVDFTALLYRLKQRSGKVKAPIPVALTNCPVCGRDRCEGHGVGEG